MSENLNNNTVEELVVPTEPETSVQPRFKSWALWVSVIGAIWTVASAFGLTEKIGISESTFKTVLDCVGTILVGFGIVNNPTDKDNF